ncbi:MAG: ABC transporter substrate-binding protein [Candidatus Korarchaeota archaeon]|nr:ABC transporter substrate-binding protein [Thermoproteota archaeon]MCR8472263.1 ABC transporter substrate-binding protein [Thermoproteota archaeon]
MLAAVQRRKIVVGIIVAIIIIGGIAAYLLLRPAPPKPKIRVFYNAGNVERERIATALAAEWGKLGFEVVVQSMEWPVYLDTIMDPNAFDVYIIGWAPDYIDPDDYAAPMAYGGTRFTTLKTIEVTTAADVANYLSSAKVFEVENSWYVVVGPKGTGATVDIPTGAKILVVQYEVDEVHTLPIENSTPWITIAPSMYRNVTLDALIQAGVIDGDPTHRNAIYQAIQQITNHEVPIIWLSQHMLVRNHWTWVNGWYYHPVMPIRYDLLWEQPDTPQVEIGTLGGGAAGTPTVKYYNNKSVIVIATIGWPESFDGAFTYETFGWEILWETGDQLVTYWRTETIYPDKDLAIAWARTEDASTYYFVIRGDIKAYNRWVDKISADPEFGGTTQELYNISALDVLFSIWRVGWLEADPSWMVTAYIDYNESKVLTEDEFNSLLNTTPLIAEYKGQTAQVSNLSQLLEFFGSTNISTANVVELKLTMPYPAILAILADAFLSVVPMKYVFDAIGWNYTQALLDIENGKKIYNLAKYINKTAFEEEKSHRLLHKYPIATGPFYVYDYKDNTFIILKKNPYYWNATLYTENPNYGTIDYVIFVIYDETAPRLSLYKAGAADFCYVPRANIPEVNGTTYPDTPYKINIVASPELLTFDIDFIVLNTYRYPLNISLVRQALTWAVPFEKIYKEIYEGLVAQLYGVIPKGMLGYTEKNIIKYTYNLTKAKELIKASGIFKTSAAIESVIPAVPIVVLPLIVRKKEE